MILSFSEKAVNATVERAKHMLTATTRLPAAKNCYRQSRCNGN
jgi:hypothetical protein